MTVTVEAITKALLEHEGTKPTIVVTATTAGLKQASVTPLGLTLRCSPNCPEDEFVFEGAAAEPAAAKPVAKPATKSVAKSVEEPEKKKRGRKKTSKMSDYFSSRSTSDDE